MRILFFTIVASSFSMSTWACMSGGTGLLKFPAGLAKLNDMNMTASANNDAGKCWQLSTKSKDPTQPSYQIYYNQAGLPCITKKAQGSTDVTGCGLDELKKNILTDTTNNELSIFQQSSADPNKTVNMIVKISGNSILLSPPLDTTPANGDSFDISNHVTILNHTSDMGAGSTSCRMDISGVSGGPSASVFDLQMQRDLNAGQTGNPGGSCPDGAPQAVNLNGFACQLNTVENTTSIAYQGCGSQRNEQNVAAQAASTQ